MKITVSGISYFAAIDGSGVPAEQGWPTPTVRRVGKGRQYVYEVNPEQADDVRWHLEQLGSTWVGCNDDAEMSRDGRACLRDAARIEAALAAIGGAK